MKIEFRDARNSRYYGELRPTQYHYCATYTSELTHIGNLYKVLDPALGLDYVIYNLLYK